MTTTAVAIGNKSKIKKSSSTECCPSILAAPLTEVEASSLSVRFNALGDPSRLRLLSLLAAEPNGVCACDLVVPLEKSQPTVSHHLKVLAEAGLVTSERKGRWIWYSVVRSALDDLRTALMP